MKRSLRALAVLWLISAPVAAQQTTGTVTGRVLDQQGAPIPGATVTARSILEKAGAAGLLATSPGFEDFGKAPEEDKNNIQNRQRFIGTIANPVPNPDFMRPTVYAGDFRQGEQRVGQIGFRFAF